MADNLGPNGLVVSAGKCAASMAAENCYRRKFLLVPFLIFRPFRFFVFFRNYNGQKQPGHWAEVVCHFHLLFYTKAQ